MAISIIYTVKWYNISNISRLSMTGENPKLTWMKNSCQIGY